MEPEQHSGNTRETASLSIPMAIVIAGVVIASAILFINGNRTPAAGPAAEQLDPKTINFKAVSAAEHIIGSPDVPVIIIEYSDLECPFCKVFHASMKRIVSEFGDKKVAWVYRHFPLDSIHPKARKEAEATECATELGGNTAFWKYTDRIFEITPSNNGLDPAKLPEIAEEIGLNRKAFEACLASGRHAAFVDEQASDAIAAGAQGTPHSIIVSKGGKITPLQGALPFEELKKMINDLL